MMKSKPLLKEILNFVWNLPFSYTIFLDDFYVFLLSEILSFCLPQPTNILFWNFVNFIIINTCLRFFKKELKCIKVINYKIHIKTSEIESQLKKGGSPYRLIKSNTINRCNDLKTSVIFQTCIRQFPNIIVG